MKKGIFLASLLLLGVGGIDGENVANFAVAVRAAEPVQNTSGLCGATPNIAKTLEEARDLCAVAKATYSSRYGCGFQQQDAELSPEEKARLTEEERVYFGEICDGFQKTLADTSNWGTDETLASARFHLGEMKYCQPNSPVVAKLADVIRGLFSEDNFQLEISESVASAAMRRNIENSISVNEIIRGTRAVGSGVLRGVTSVDFRPNSQQAEFQLVLDADITTRTVGTNRGVRVYSDNFGNIVASKTIYWSDEGLQTTPSASVGSMKTRVNGVNADFVTLFNGAMIQNRVQRELPLSERESSRRMNAQVSTELDAEANKQIGKFNERWNRARQAVDDDERILRRIESRTEEERLYFSCLVGKKEQFGTPIAEPTAIAAQTPSTPGAVEARSKERYSASATNASRRAVVMRAHQSAPNNAAFVALTGLTLGEEDMFDALIQRFPGLDRATAKSFLEKYRKNASDGENAADGEKLRFQFDAERPFNVAFVDDKIETTLRFSSFEAGGRAWEDLEIKFVYKIVAKDGGVAFQRELVDVLPGGLDPDAPIPARFQAFRSVVMKRLESAILDEYVAAKIPLQNEANGSETFGELVPKTATARDGWFVAEFDFIETPR